MAYQHTSMYKKAMRKRQVWIESKFGELKEWHQGRRYRLRGILKVNMEALLKAADKISSNFSKEIARQADLFPPQIKLGCHYFYRFFLPQYNITHAIAPPTSSYSIFS